jgi:rRNA maturation endonuclease Nob1
MLLFVLLTLALLVLLIIGLVNPSKILRWSKKPTKLKVLLWWLLINFIIVITFSLLLSNENNDSHPVDENKEEIKSNIDDDNTIQKNQIIVEETEDEKIKEQLLREIESIDKGIDFSTYHNASKIEILQLELALFNAWASTIKNGEVSGDVEVQGLAKKLKIKVSNIQIKEFPLLRKQYVKIMAKLLWEEDIEVSANGTSSKYINITGGIFAANKNKQDFQNTIHEVLKQFRFNQSRYRWYKGDDQYTYYTIYEGKDSDLVIFE